MHCYSCKISHVQELFPSDLSARVPLALEFFARMKVDKEWTWKILWTDEAHFHLEKYVNALNCRILSTESPLETQPVPLHPAKVNVGWGFTASFKSSSGHIFFVETGDFGNVTFTVTGQSYECILRNHVIPTIHQRECMDRSIFMQYGAHQHIANPVKQLLKRHFGNARIIS